MRRSGVRIPLPPLDLKLAYRAGFIFEIADRSMTIIALVRRRDIGIQNAMNLGDGLWIQRRAMIAWRNELAPGAVEMTAPIGDDAVAAFWGVTAPPVTYDGVVCNGSGNRKLVDAHDKAVIRSQRIDAIREAVQLKGGLDRMSYSVV